MKTKRIYLILLFLAFSTSVIAKKNNVSDSISFNVHLNANTHLILWYQNDYLIDQRLIFRNNSLKDSIVSKKIASKNDMLFYYSVYLPESKVQKNIYYNFVLSSNEEITLKLLDSYEIICLNPDRKLVFANKELNLVGMFDIEQASYDSKLLNSGIKKYDIYIDSIYASNLKKLDSLTKLQLITEETGKSWNTLIALDHYNRLLKPISTPTSTKTVASFKQKAEKAKILANQLQTIKGLALRSIITRLISYNALSLGKQTNDLNFCTQYLLSSYWGDEVIIGSLIQELDQYPEKNSTTFKKSFEDFRNLCKKNGKEEIATKLSSKYFPLTTNYNQILLVNADGKPSTLAKVLQKEKGKLIFLDLWASWCSPCRKEIPVLEKMKKKFPNQHIEFISISLDKNVATKAWTTAMKQENLTDPHQYRMLDVSNSLLSKTFQVESIPRYLVFDRKGEILNDNFPRPSGVNFESQLRTYLKL